jgi:AcrR family transcriptional regulator
MTNAVTLPEREPEPPDIDAVLDAAADVFVNDGFDSVTLRRLAARFGVDESSLFERFGSIEQLLVRMLNREYARMVQVIVDDVERDPLGGRLSRIYRYVLSAVHERPLASTLFLNGSDGLSRLTLLTEKRAHLPRIGARADLIEKLKEAGTVRPHVDSAAVSAVISALFTGVALNPQPSIGDVVDGLAQLLETAADTEDPDTSRGKAVFFAYAQELVARDG